MSTATVPAESDVAKEALAISWGMVYGVEDVNGFSSMQPRRYVDYLFGPDMGELTNGLLKDAQLLRAESPILSSLNVKYLLIPAALHPRLGDNFRLVHRSAQVQTYQNLAVYPRAYFADEVRLAADPAAVLRAVRADGFDGRRLALVEAPSLPAHPAAGPHAPAQVQEKQRAATHLTFATSTAETRLLVLSEMYFPGWQAFVDGAGPLPPRPLRPPPQARTDFAAPAAGRSRPAPAAETASGRVRHAGC